MLFNFRDFTIALETAWDLSAAVPLPPAAPALRDEEDQLNTIVRSAISDDSSSFKAADLRKLIRYIALSDVLNDRDGELLLVLEKLAGHFSVSAGLASPVQRDWCIALAAGRRLLALNNFRVANIKTDNMVKGLSRLLADGHSFVLDDRGIDPNSNGFSTASTLILQYLQQAGREKAFAFLEGLARLVNLYEFDQVLYSRNPVNQPREASIPFGFLWQLAARVEDRAPTVPDHNIVMHKAVATSRDLVAMTAVESYGQFWALNVSTNDLDRWLADATLNDHLFSLQQWTPYITPLILRHFFGTDHDEKLRRELGWGVDDVAVLAEIILRKARTSPGYLTSSDLQPAIPVEVSKALSRDLTHQAPAPNANYLTPFSATQADLMFRPFSSCVSTGRFFIPTCSASGPALYEAVVAGLRKVFPDNISNMTGDGLERATGAILKFRGLNPTIEAKKYHMNGIDGECDLVLEDEQTIIFIECKAKPITRAAMSGEMGDPTLLYLEGIVASQTQALQHETILEEHDRIEFEDNLVLNRKGRKIIRLSITLFDYGTLQDRFVFSHLSAALTNSELASTDSRLKKRVKKANEILDKLRSSLGIQKDMTEDAARNVWIRSLPTASLSIGQLAAILVEEDNVSKLARVLSRPASFATGSVLKEYHFLKKQQLI
ncbi:MAG TPA: hypothetical protein GXX48_10355 [Ochrobactrum intermedium]|uniref:NERD domain-containing protein n=1 Tax=Brucella intermedia TaxID=94625 RepID=A0A7V6PBM1_9HYPH|nr:hypothetical protein [Brucella intermedia]HHV68027.1 hypothetical protein [Brucella intermedia]